jgi:phage tail-like protein
VKLGLRLVPAVMAVAIVLYGSATAAAVQSSPVVSSATFQIVEDGNVWGSFSALTSINTEVESKEYTYVDEPSGVQNTKQYGLTKPPTFTLKTSLGTKPEYHNLWKWHEAAQAGSATARQNFLLEATDGQQIFTWEVHNAWPSKLEFSAGQHETDVLTVTFAADEITTAPSGLSSLPTGGVASPATPNGTPGTLAGVSCASATACAAVGADVVDHVNRPLVERWNGSIWTTQTAPMPTGARGALLTAVSCPSATACTAVGEWHDAHGIGHTLAESWNGSTWSVQATVDVSGAPTSELTGVSCPTSTACEAVGEAAGPRQTLALAESWSGSVWERQPVPGPTLYGPYLTKFTSVSCTSPTACIAVGGNSGQALAASWNGSRWSLQAPAIPAGATSSLLSAVSCTAIGGCTASGSWTSGAGTRALIEQWSGSAWSAQSLPVPAGERAMALGGVSCTSASACVAVGSIVNGQVGRKLLVESWNGSSWRKLATPNPAGETGTAYSSVACIAGASCVAVGAAAHPTATAVMQEFAG